MTFEASYEFGLRQRILVAAVAIDGLLKEGKARR
jgi:hypothetical protein